MKHRLAVQVVAAVVVVVFALGIWASGDKVDVTWLRFFSAAVLAAVAILGFWDRVLWKIPLVQRVRSVPRSVGGTWQGTLTSFWTDPETGQTPAPKPAYLVVRQTASAVSVVLLTDESRSWSSYGVVSTVDGAVSLDYIYLHRPDSRVEHRSRMHHGSASFDIIGRPATRLRGRYWTDRDSKGELDFTQRRNKTADDYETAAALFA
jgi:hypothetical protein